MFKKKRPVGGQAGTDESAKPARKNKRPRKGLRILKNILFTLVLVGILGFGVVSGYIYKVISETEPIKEFNISALLDESSVLMDQNGNVIENIHVNGLRKIVKYNDINPILINAYIAVEDKTFREHHGFNFVRVAGAVVESITEGVRTGGTSTITQQLARNLYLSDIKSQRSMSRKVREAYYAVQLESRMTKDQIIEAYLNTIYLGSGTKGVQAAAQTYFSKNASELGLVESALLAGIPKNPTKNSPFITIEKSKVKTTDFIMDDSHPTLTTIFNESCVPRFKLALKLIYENGYITKEEYDAAKDVDIKTYLNPGKVKTTDISSYFTDLAKKEVVQVLMSEKDLTEEQATNMLYGGGLKIYSTIDVDLQKKLEAAYEPLPFTEKYDDKTKVAVKKFQTMQQLDPTGVADINTIKRLDEMGLLDAAALTLDSLKPGDASQDVIAVKEALEKTGLLFKSNPKMPTILAYKDSMNNIVALSQKNRRTVVNSEILLNSYDTAITPEENLVIGQDNYKFDAEGNLVLYADRMFSFYRAYGKDNEVKDIQIILKDCYRSDESREKVIGSGGVFYAKKVNIPEMFIYKGGALKVPYESKRLDEDQNMIISKSFLTSNPNMFRSDNNGNLLVPKDFYSLSNTGIIQPQSAMVIMDYHSGQIKALVGGRNVTGQKIYNRALHPRQPGSAIKPIGVYLTAIDNGYTAASVFDDVPRYQGGTRWPINWYDSDAFKYWGLMPIRRAIEWSNNVIAVKVGEAVGVENVIPYLEKLGITSIDKEGPVNDINLAAISLGGMTQGISPLEMTGAYSSIANKGVYIKPTTFTKIEGSDGKIIFEQTPYQEKVVGPQTAFIIQDMLRTTAVSGLATPAAISPGNSAIPVAGKTGTTSNKFDAWFAGFTPYYAAAIWIGNDVQMELSDGSNVSAIFWREVMKAAHEGLAPKNFDVPEGMVRASVDTTSGKRPSNLSSMDPRGTVITEWFVPGTVPAETDDVHVTAEICSSSGKLATEFCPPSLVETKVFIKRTPPYVPAQNIDGGKSIQVKDYQYQVPTEVCDQHNAESLAISGAANVFASVKIELAPDGVRTIMEPSTAQLTDGTLIKLPVGTTISTEGAIRLSDGTVVYVYMIRLVYPDSSAPTNLQ